MCPDSPVTDHATLILDASSPNQHCWFRKNFGVNGVVDARQCGVVGDGLPAAGTDPNTPGYHPDDGAFLQNCLSVAADKGYHVVSTGGGVILDNGGSGIGTDITVTGDMELTCGGLNTGLQNSDDRIFNNNGNLQLAGAIVLDPTASVGDHSGFRILLSGVNSALGSCTVEAGAGPFNTTTSTYPNPYSPSIWYTKCLQGDANHVPCNTGDASLRSSLLEGSAFNPNITAQYHGSGCTGHCGPASISIGIYVTGEHAVVRNVTVLGFGTCYQSIGGNRMRMNDFFCDGNAGIDIDTLGGGAGRLQAARGAWHLQRQPLTKGCAGDCATGFDIRTPDAPRIRDCSIGLLLTSGLQNGGIAAP